MITLQEIHDELDAFNCINGTKIKLCFFCDSNTYSGKEGIIHTKECLIKKIRLQLKENDKS